MSFSLKQLYFVEINIHEPSQNPCTIWTRIRMRKILRPLDWIWYFIIKCYKCSFGALCHTVCSYWNHIMLDTIHMKPLFFFLQPEFHVEFKIAIEILLTSTVKKEVCLWLSWSLKMKVCFSHKIYECCCWTYLAH